MHERQFRQEAPLCALSLPRVHSIAAWASALRIPYGGADSVVVVAEHGQSSALDQAHHRIDRPFRIGAIADIIAEADHPLGAPRPREVKAGAERLPVGMDVGEKSQPHAFLRNDAYGRAADLMDIKGLDALER